jgi:hypothetical protein
LFGTAGYFATQVMDWKPLQMIVLQRALLPIVRVGVCSPIFMAGAEIGRLGEAARLAE